MDTDFIEFFKFPDFPDFDPNVDYSKSATSLLKLKSYVYLFNQTLNRKDVGEDWCPEDDWKLYLSSLERAILYMKVELGINQPIQSNYF